MAQLSKVLDLAMLRHDSYLQLDDTLKSLQQSLNKSEEYFVSTQVPSIPPSPDEDLVSSANLGAALRGLVIGLNPSPIVMKTNDQILAMSPLFPMVLGST